MNDRLFGTDGMRGIAGEFPLDEPTIFQLGKSLTKILKRESKEAPGVIIGRDTRESGHRIECALAAGIVAEGGRVESAGIATTPGIAFFTRTFGFDAGVVISASHNPYKDNGIKIFSPTGRKLEDRFEREIEGDLTKHPEEKPDRDFKIEPSRLFNQKYLRYLLTEIAGGLELFGVRVAIDCANGASAEIAPTLFKAMGAEVHCIGVEPDGKNINEARGALHPEHLQQTVVDTKSHLGIAFDGDADRAMFVDDKGVIRDGDFVLYILGKHLKSLGTLSGNKVVATVMSNIGLEIALKELGIELTRASVGDKYVLEDLIRTKASLGGEQSGHIIFPKISLAGDGLITALQILKVITEGDRSLRELAAGMHKYPQILVNVAVSRKFPFENLPEIQEEVQRLEKELHGHGRLLLRYSGTENLARVMIEGQDQKSIDKQAKELAELIQTTIG